MESNEIKKLKIGCKRQLGRKKWMIRNYKGSDDAHFLCGHKMPKDWKKDKRNRYDRFYCDGCNRKIKKQIAKEKLEFLENHYSLNLNKTTENKNGMD